MSPAPSVPSWGATSPWRRSQTQGRARHVPRCTTGSSRSKLCISGWLPRIVGLLSELMQLMRQPHRPMYQFTILISISQVVSIRIFCLITVCDLLRLQRSILSILHDSNADTLTMTGREAWSTTSRSELCVWCYVLGFGIDVGVSS